MFKKKCIFCGRKDKKDNLHKDIIGSYYHYACRLECLKLLEKHVKNLWSQ